MTSESTRRSLYQLDAKLQQVEKEVKEMRRELQNALQGLAQTRECASVHDTTGHAFIEYPFGRLCDRCGLMRREEDDPVDKV